MTTQDKSYRQIVRTTLIIGGSSIIEIFLGIVRTKFFAILLGPSGVGLMGLYNSVISIAGTVSSMGINSSGVRQIAEASGTGNQQQIAKILISLRRVSLFMGLIGMAIMIVFRNTICRLTFGNTEHAGSLALLSVTIFFSVVSGGQSALIQGMRRLRELASLKIFGAFCGTIFSIPIIYALGEKGIVLFMIVVSAIGIINSWWHARKIQIVPQISIKWSDTYYEAKSLLKLGIVFMSSGLMTVSTNYFLSVLVVRKFGLNGAGIYQAASALASIYVGFILNAMGTDFYPKLTAVAHNNSACNRLVNEQAEISILLAVPGILITLTLAPIIIQLFYSDKFIVAYEILRWQILGIFLRIVAWPMGFILLAKGEGKLFFCTELIGNGAHIFLIWISISYFGLSGTGIGFFGCYIFVCILIFFVVRQLSGFRWSSANIQLGCVFISTIIAVFISKYFLSDIRYIILGITASIVIVLYSMKQLFAIAGFLRPTDFLIKIRTLFGVHKGAR
jgi:PST family polysaccharide transporter